MAVLVTLPGNLSLATHQAGVWLLPFTVLTSGPQTLGLQTLTESLQAKHQAGPTDDPIRACLIRIIWISHQCPALGSRGVAKVSPCPQGQTHPSMAPREVLRLPTVHTGDLAPSSVPVPGVISGRAQPQSVPNYLPSGGVFWTFWPLCFLRCLFAQQP